MPRRAWSYAVLAALLLLPAPAAGQSAEHAPLVLQISSDPASRALGGAFRLERPTSDALFAHPAVLTDAEGIGASTRIYGEGATYAAASGARPWWSGGIAAGLRVLSYTTAEVGRLLETGARSVPTEGDLFDDRKRSVTELVASVGYARSLLGVDVGVTGSWTERRSRQDLDRTITADVGVATELGPGRAALTVRSLGGDLDADDPDGGRLPTELVAAFAVGREPLGPLDVGAAAEIGRRADGEVVPAGGLEVAWWPIWGRTFVGRVGYRRMPEAGVDPLTLGAGFEGDDVRIEYAWQGADGAGDVHSFGLSWR